MIVREEGSAFADSRELAERFHQRHHNVLKAIDLVIWQCPEAEGHFRFRDRPVTAGLGGTRYVRYALIDHVGFMLLAMTFPSTRRSLARNWLLALSDHASGDGATD